MRGPLDFILTSQRLFYVQEKEIIGCVTFSLSFV